MKKTLLICFSICSQFAFGQKGESFSVSGTINLDSGNILFSSLNDSGDYPDSILYLPAPVKSGNFYFEGKIPQPVKIKLQAQVAGINIYVSEGFYLVSGSQTIHCKIDTTSYDRETPNIHNPVMDEYLQKYWSLERQAIDTIGDYNIKLKAVRTYVIKYAEKNPDSYVSLWEIAENLSHGYDDPLNQAFAGLTPNIKTSFTGKRVTGDLLHLGLIAIGRSFPAIETIGLAGNNQRISFSSLKAKYVFVDFWYSHCGSCIGQFPAYTKIVNDYHSKGFIMIGISSDATPANIADWKEVIYSHALPWEQYRTDDVSIKNLHINYFPSNFLLDSTGKIIAKDLAPSEVAAFLHEKL
jgi:hypothetical protein